MSKESATDLVELSQSLVDAANRRDVEAVMSFFAADAVWEALAVGLERVRGRTAIGGMAEDIFRLYDEYRTEVEELLDLGSGVSFSLVVQKGRLVGGSGFVQMRTGVVMLRDGGLITRMASYLDLDEARAAAERLAEERG
jgi:ketosteroid isomerase-like protein